MLKRYKLIQSKSIYTFA